MRFTNIRDLRYSSKDNSTIDLFATCSEYGEIPMTLNISDTEDIHTFWDGKKEYPLEEYCLTKTIAAYVKPEEVPEVVFVPMSITQRQCRLKLNQMGKYKDVVNFIENSEDDEIKIEWEYATEIERNNPLVSTLGEQLGLTKEQLDNLFVEASKL